MSSCHCQSPYFPAGAAAGRRGPSWLKKVSLHTRDHALVWLILIGLLHFGALWLRHRRHRQVGNVDDPLQLGQRARRNSVPRNTGRRSRSRTELRVVFLRRYSVQRVAADLDIRVGSFACITLMKLRLPSLPARSAFCSSSCCFSPRSSGSVPRACLGTAAAGQLPPFSRQALQRQLVGIGDRLIRPA